MGSLGSGDSGSPLAMVRLNDPRVHQFYQLTSSHNAISTNNNILQQILSECMFLRKGGVDPMTSGKN